MKMIRHLHSANKPFYQPAHSASCFDTDNDWGFGDCIYSIAKGVLILFQVLQITIVLVSLQDFREGKFYSIKILSMSWLTFTLSSISCDEPRRGLVSRTEASWGLVCYAGSVEAYGASWEACFAARRGKGVCKVVWS